MLEYQIVEMRRTVLRITLRPRPPLTVYIQKNHAEYLGVQFSLPSVDPDEPKRPIPPGTKKTHRLVEVELAELFAKLKEAKGVEQDQHSGEGNQPAANQT